MFLPLKTEVLAKNQYEFAPISLLMRLNLIRDHNRESAEDLDLKELQVHPNSVSASRVKEVQEGLSVVRSGAGIQTSAFHRLFAKTHTRQFRSGRVSCCPGGWSEIPPPALLKLQGRLRCCDR